MESATKLTVIITGSTGMVGEGVLHECLQHEDVSEILLLNRKPCGISHPKIKEIIHQDFFDIQPLEGQLTGYNTCFFCLGVSSVGMKENDFYQFTYILTMHIAQLLTKLNGGMTFCYVSGTGTDSSEKGKRMWARVKGKTENDLQKLPFKHVYNFRPGGLQPTAGLRNTHSYYIYLGWLIPLIKLFAPMYVSTLKQLGIAMINAALYGYNRNILEVKDIISLSKKTTA